MKKVLSFIAFLILLAAMIPCALAAETPFCVVDEAGLFSIDEIAKLEEKALSLRNRYETDVVIVTVSGLNGKRAQDYADDFFNAGGYGYGSDQNGVIFLLAMEEREWYISTSGSMIYALTDYGIEQLGNVAISSGLSRGAYYDAFDAYLDALPEYLSAYQNHAPIDGYADYSGDHYHGDQEEVVYYTPPAKSRVNLFLSAIVGLIVSGVSVGAMRSSMNTKRRQYGAANYLRKNSYNMSTMQDLFLYSNVTRTPRPQNNSSGGHSGGGSSMHHSSGGHSHGGGGGKF